jgi:F0F1-type ATP synthase assembly protein I
MTVFDVSAKRQLNNGFGSALARGFDIAITPVVFGLIGWLIDRWAGTSPGFTIGLAAFGVTGMFVRLWLGYDREMKAHEAQLPGRPRGSAS